MAIFSVTNLNDSGAGSLRAAIVAANASGTASTIHISVAGTITLASGLPTLSKMVTIDATTAPGYVAGGAPVVELNCNSNPGLVFGAGSAGSQLLAIAVDNASGDGVTLIAGTITLAGNYIGLNLVGAAFGNGGDGVHVANTSSNNLIGSNPTAAPGVVSNVISGNGGNGISFNGSSGNTVVNNYIGTDPTGATAIGNGGNGILLTGGANNNEIGGTAFTNINTTAINNPTGTAGTVAPVFVVPPLGNLVSGNSLNGILIDTASQNNVMNGNFVGTTANGDAALGNTLDGVDINGANNNSLIGGQSANPAFAYYNVLSGNGGTGLHITNSSSITVQANFFGIGANNSSIVANSLDGILVDGTSANVTVGGIMPLGNVAAGNGLNGIEVAGAAGSVSTVNTFGGLFAFGGAAPNGNDGLLISATGGNQTVRANVFSGNIGNGIEIAGNASGVTIGLNTIGLTTNGGTILANGIDNLVIAGTTQNIILACFAAGTRIRTARGDVAVEALVVGDDVALAGQGSATRPIRWIGHRRIDCQRHPRPTDVWPVRVRADAFGAGLPCRDLWLSPDHAVFIDGALIPIRCLVNDGSVAQQDRAEVTYFHIELDLHDVMLAEGMPCESWLDTGNRADFANGGQVVRLHLALAHLGWDDACAPLVVAGPALDAARALLLGKAAPVRQEALRRGAV